MQLLDDWDDSVSYLPSSFTFYFGNEIYSFLRFTALILFDGRNGFIQCFEFLTGQCVILGCDPKQIEVIEVDARTQEFFQVPPFSVILAQFLEV